MYPGIVREMSGNFNVWRVVSLMLTAHMLSSQSFWTVVTTFLYSVPWRCCLITERYRSVNTRNLITVFIRKNSYQDVMWCWMWNTGGGSTVPWWWLSSVSRVCVCTQRQLVRDVQQWGRGSSCILLSARDRSHVSGQTDHGKCALQQQMPQLAWCYGQIFFTSFR